MVLAEAKAHLNIERSALPVYELLAPFFFVVVGVDVDLRVLADSDLLAMVAALTLLAVAGKLAGCGLGAWGLGWRRMATIGVGMVPRGEVGLAAVSLGRALNAIPEELFSIIVVVSLFTTVMVPPMLTRLACRTAPDEQPARPARGERRAEALLRHRHTSPNSKVSRS